MDKIYARRAWDAGSIPVVPASSSLIKLKRGVKLS